jgi:hypothetical protein
MRLDSPVEVAAVAAGPWERSWQVRELPDKVNPAAMASAQPEVVSAAAVEAVPEAPEQQPAQMVAQAAMVWPTPSPAHQ